MNKIPSLICFIVPLRDVDMIFRSHLKHSICGINKIIHLRLRTFYIISNQIGGAKGLNGKIDAAKGLSLQYFLLI